MLKPVRVGKKDFTDYREIIGFQLHDEIKRLAKQFKGARLLHVNATSHGGGVAQILHSLVPLMRDLGIDAHWKLINPKKPEFFAVTKKIHNALQGDKKSLTRSEWKLYEAENKQFAKDLNPESWDYIIIHDPQPAAMLHFLLEGKQNGPTARQKPKWVWRCHIDLSAPNKEAAEHLALFLDDYDGAVFTLKDYVLKTLAQPKIGVIPVAIDPLTPKNRLLSWKRAHMLVAAYGVSLDKPMVVQISRFDPWKDPLGVIEAWEIAKKSIPELQLILMGDAASDDPEGKDVLAQVIKRVGKQDNVFLITDTNDEAVNAFQHIANVVLQKSIREGFGLTVSEALWSKRPVIGGKVGGIPQQIKHGKNGYLVNSPKEAAKYMVMLLKDPLKAERMGLWGHEYVREHFLLPHMLKADLEFLALL